mgnify:CR=1 FL=1
MRMGLSSLEEGGKPVYGTTFAQVAAGCAAACIADHEAAMPRKELGGTALLPRSSTTPGASNFGR